MTEDGTTIPVPVGSYELEEGTTFVVEEEGVISSMGEAEEVEAEDDEDYGDHEDKEEMSTETKLADFSEVVMTLFTEMKEEIDNLKLEVEELSGQSLAKDENIEELQKENVELSKKLNDTPATENLNTKKFAQTKLSMLSSEDYNKMTAQEKFLYDIKK